MKRVVVTGLGVITPVGNDVETFFANLVNGVRGIDYITRFDAAEYKVKIAAEVKDFNVLDYVQKSDARRMDLYTQYAVAAAMQAVQDSGIAGSVDAGRFGVYVGSGIGGISTFIKEAEKLLTGGPGKISPFFVPMMISNMAAGTIAISFNAQGPCLPVVTACATSTHAIGEAFRAIRHGYADAIIAGGSEAAVNPLAIAGFSNCMALTFRNDPSSASIPFDRRRDGFVLGEGAGIVILEEYEHAVARGAKIYAEVTGYGNTCDAYHITAPHPESRGAEQAIRLALADSGVDSPEEIDTGKIYFNAHGTSTPLNDAAETRAIKNVFGRNAAGVHISSTKSMTGHMLGAAGAVEAVASILALKNGVVPPTIGYEQPDPDCDLNYTPNKSVHADLELALSSSLGFGGHNGVLAFSKSK
ncbi:MAG: beta-ketoacyl-ACP synthase II [Clostridiales bacterium]|nr:beta-ketoacyl-ACP synthase II [Clostridiales bacterium]